MNDSRIEGRNVQEFFRNFADEIQKLSGNDRSLLDNARLYCLIELDPEDAFEQLNGKTVQFMIANYGTREIRDGFTIEKDEFRFTAFPPLDND